MKGLCSGIASSVDFVIYIYMYIIRNGFRERITQSLLVYLNKTEAKKNMNDLVYSQVRSKPQSRKPITYSFNLFNFSFIYNLNLCIFINVSLSEYNV